MKKVIIWVLVAIVVITTSTFVFIKLNKNNDNGEIVIEKEGIKEYYFLLDSLGDYASVYEGLNCRIELRIKESMDEREITVVEMARITELRYEPVNGYYEGTIRSTDLEIKAFFCVALNCEPDDLEVLVYENKHMQDRKDTYHRFIEKV